MCFITNKTDVLNAAEPITVYKVVFSRVPRRPAKGAYRSYWYDFVYED